MNYYRVSKEYLLGENEVLPIQYFCKQYIMRIQNIFKDKTGKIVVGQWPNWPIWLTLAFYVLRFIPNHLIQSGSNLGVSLTLLYWSYLEITEGVITFRRLIGIAVAISQFYLIISYLSL